MDYLGLTGNDLEHVRGHEGLLSKRVLKNPDEARLQALLWWVIWHGTIEQLRQVLSAGADPNFVHNDGNPPLGLVLRWRSAKDNPVEFFQELIQNGADPTRGADNKSLMTVACQHGNTQWAIEPLLDATPSGQMPQADLNQALFASVNNVALTRRLLNAGAAVNAQQHSSVLGASISVLMLAAYYGDLEVTELLLASGAKVNLKDGEGHTALDYALVDSKASRKTIPLLEKAGAISGKSFEDDNPFRGFAAAARKPAYKSAVARVKELIGVNQSPLITEEGKIPGGQGFLFESDLGKALVERRHADFAAHANPVREFVEQHQAEIRAMGYHLFYSRDITSKNGDVVALLPTGDVYQVIEALETNGQDSTEDLIAWLRELEKVQPFLITGIGVDFIDGKFTTQIKDPTDITERINNICPGDSLTPAEKAAASHRLQMTNRLFLWWD